MGHNTSTLLDDVSEAILHPLRYGHYGADSVRGHECWVMAKYILAIKQIRHLNATTSDAIAMEYYIDHPLG